LDPFRLHPKRVLTESHLSGECNVKALLSATIVAAERAVASRAGLRGLRASTAQKRHSTHSVSFIGLRAAAPTR
jgi:hypothetical protein